MTADAAKAWRRHLADYKVKPLIEQFDRRNFQLSEVKREALSLDDFQGHMLEAFKLRGRLTKLGYTRGATGDGGWFYEYEKRFTSIGIKVTIAFTGNRLPEENRTVALTTLQFTRSGDSEPSPYVNSESFVRLGEVPRVLLIECWNDMRLTAAEGSGFDPEWDKKTNS